MATDTLHAPAPRAELDGGAGPGEGQGSGFAAAWDARQKYHISPRVEKLPNGKYAIRHVPIFEKHDREDVHCDDRWMYACADDQKKNKARGYLPRLIKGHNPDEPNGVEKPADAFLDNYDYAAGEGVLYADYVDVPAELLAEIKANKWPGRSAEANRSRPSIEVVALLGGTPPYFKLPDLKYASDNGKHYFFSECHMATKEKSEMRQLYEDISEMQKPAADAGAAAAPNAEDEQYKKFCELLKRFLAKAFSEESTAPAAAQKNEADYAADNDASKAEQAKKEETEKMSAKNQNESTQKYAELESRIKASESRVTDLLARVDKSEAEKVALEDKLERQEWTAKYQESGLPKGRIDIGENVELIMSVSKDKRKKYFDQSLKNVAVPTLTPVKQENGAAPINAGSEEEAAAIRQYYNDNREKFRGDYAAAQRSYRAEKGIRY